MKYTDTVIIGGGQAGLAMSRCLVERGVEHVVLERGRVGERWRTERWDSLRLLTPNWQSRLPHFHYRGDDPDGYMTIREFIEHLERYARSCNAPVHGGTTVQLVEKMTGGSYRVTTDRQATGRRRRPTRALELPEPRTDSCGGRAGRGSLGHGGPASRGARECRAKGHAGRRAPHPSSPDLSRRSRGVEGCGPVHPGPGACTPGVVRHRSE